MTSAVGGSKNTQNTQDVNNDGWVTPDVDTKNVHIDGMSPTAMLAAIFDLGEQSANLGRVSSMMSTHNSLEMVKVGIEDAVNAVKNTFKSDMIAAGGQLAGGVASMTCGSVLAGSGQMGLDSAFQTSGSLTGIYSAAAQMASEPAKREAGLDQAAGQAANTYEGLDQKWADSSTSVSSSIMEKIESVNEALAGINGQGIQATASSF